MRETRGRAEGRIRTNSLALLCGALGLLAACRGAEKQERVRGAVGVFYGGQVQELSEVTVTSVNPPTLGFRLDFLQEAEEKARNVRFEVVRPGPAGRRVTETGEQTISPERRRYDQTIELPQSAPLGTINVRVVVDSQIVIDRALLLRGER